MSKKYWREQITMLKRIWASIKKGEKNPEKYLKEQNNEIYWREIK